MSVCGSCEHRHSQVTLTASLYLPIPPPRRISLPHPSFQVMKLGERDLVLLAPSKSQRRCWCESWSPHFAREQRGAVSGRMEGAEHVPFGCTKPLQCILTAPSQQALRTRLDCTVYSIKLFFASEVHLMIQDISNLER